MRKDAFFSCRKVWCCSLFRGKVSTGKHLTFVCRAGPSQCKYICENQAHTKDRAIMGKPVTCTSSSSFLWEGQLFGTALGSFPKVTEPEHTGWITEKAQGRWSIQSMGNTPAQSIGWILRQIAGLIETFQWYPACSAGHHQVLGSRREPSAMSKV